MSSDPKKHRFFIIDASSFIFRAFFALPPLSTSKGLPTNAVYGFVTMLLKVMDQEKPNALVCVFDSKEPSFRKEMYHEYKANRGAPPDDLIPQFEYIHKAVEALGLQKIMVPGYEADDLIATLTEKFKNCEIVIVSSDKDLMQLVDDRVKILDTMKDKLYGEKEVQEKLGVPPLLVPDYLGLIGDSSDNIPGVPSIGPKTAVALLNEHGSLENVLKAAPDMKGKRAEVLTTHAEDARLSKKLAIVLRDIQHKKVNDLKYSDFAVAEKLPSEFGDFLRTLEFHTLAKKYGFEDGGSTAGGSHIAVGAEGPQTALVTTVKQFHAMLEELHHCADVAFDTETRGVRTRDIEMVGFSFCGDGTKAYYIPVGHQGADNLPLKEALSGIQKILSTQNIIAQNLKYDLKVLLNAGLTLDDLQAGFSVKLTERFFDTMLAHYIVDPEGKHGLDALAAQYLGITVGDFKEVLGDHPDFSHVPLDKALQYGAMDAWSTWRLKKPLLQEMKKLSQEKLFHEIEMPVAFVLTQMEWDGVAVDKKVLYDLSEEYAAELQMVEREVFRSVGSEFNLNSPKQLSEILFNKLQLPVVRKTKTGFSTDVEVLEKLALLHEVPAMIVRYRELTKLKSTYVDVIPDLIEKDGRVHASFNQAVTATGRLSSSNPNLQNIPIKSESGRKIRKAFVAGPHHVLVGADYSQVELRLVAHLSQDEALLEAFQKGKDVHRMTAAEIFHIKEDAVKPEQRAVAKAINFGLIYGKTAFGLSEELKISRKESQNYIDRYFERYKGVKQFMDDCLSKARKTGEAHTVFGRRRPIKDIHSKNMAVRNNAERMAMNTPVQGTAADIMKIAMTHTAEMRRRWGAKLVLQVHDELVLDVPQERAQEALAELKTTMSGAVKFSVPFEVEAGIADNWMDLT